MSFFLFEWDKFRAAPEMLARHGPEWAVCSGPDEGGVGSFGARAALQEMIDKIK
jgi:hypothetical protein